MAVKMLDIWGTRHDTDERPGEIADWHSLARQAEQAAMVEVVRERGAARIAALKAAAPAPGTAAVMRWTDPDAGRKTRVRKCEGTVEAITTSGLRVRSLAGYRVTCTWADLLAQQANLRDPEGALLLGGPLRRDVEAHRAGV